jgi:hypothetical protein
MSGATPVPSQLPLRAGNASARLVCPPGHGSVFLGVVAGRARRDGFFVVYQPQVGLNSRHAEQIAASLRDLADQEDDADDDPRYGLLLGLYQPGQP